MEETEDHPFERRPKLGRSPLKAQRSISVGDPRDMDELEASISDSPERNYKRKREEVAASGHSVGEEERLRETILEMCSQINKLFSLARENITTKREIKYAATKLKRLAERMTSDRITWMFEKLRDPMKSKKMDNEDEQMVMADNSTLVAEIGTQTPAWMSNQEKIEDVTAKVMMAKNIADFNEIADQPWPKESYRITKVAEGNPLGAPREFDLCIWTLREDPSMDRGLPRMLRDRFPEIMDVDGPIGRMTVETCTPNTEGGLQKRKKCYYRVEIGESEADTYDRLIELRKVMEKERSNKIALPSAYKDHIRFRKMVECIFRDYENEIVVWHPSRKQQAETIPTQMATAATKVNKKFTNTKNEGVVIIKQGGKTYADLLRDVRGALGGTGEDTGIKSIRKTKDGDLLLVAKKGEDKTLSKIIREKMVGAEVRASKTKEETLHIKDLDEVTTTEEILTAVRAATEGSQVAGYEAQISSLRPCYGGRQIATIRAEPQLAAFLVDKGTLKIGLVPCRIIKRVDIKKCYRCWNYGHQSKDCKGPNRDNLCLTCGKEGHQAKGCKNEEFCPLCEMEGHRAGSARCGVFRKALLAEQRTVLQSDRQSSREGNDNQKTKRVEDLDKILTCFESFN